MKTKHNKEVPISVPSRGCSKHVTREKRNYPPLELLSPQRKQADTSPSAVPLARVKLVSPTISQLIILIITTYEEKTWRSPRKVRKHITALSRIIHLLWHGNSHDKGGWGDRRGTLRLPLPLPVVHYRSLHSLGFLICGELSSPAYDRKREAGLAAWRRRLLRRTRGEPAKTWIKSCTSQRMSEQRRGKRRERDCT